MFFLDERLKQKYMKILFFSESLHAGGKERRLIELLKGLLHYHDFECELITLSNVIDYDYVHEISDHDNSLTLRKN